MIKVNSPGRNIYCTCTTAKTIKMQREMQESTGISGNFHGFLSGIKSSCMQKNQEGHGGTAPPNNSFPEIHGRFHLTLAEYTFFSSHVHRYTLWDTHTPP